MKIKNIKNIKIFNMIGLSRTKNKMQNSMLNNTKRLRNNPILILYIIIIIINIIIIIIIIIIININIIIIIIIIIKL